MAEIIESLESINIPRFTFCSLPPERIVADIEPAMPITMSSLHVHLFKDSSASFIEALSANGVEFSRRITLSEAPMAAGWVIEVFSTVKEATPWGALAIVIVAWLKAKSSRKVIVTMKDNTVIHMEGLSVEQVAKVLENTKNAAIIEIPPKDNP